MEALKDKVIHFRDLLGKKGLKYTYERKQILEEVEKMILDHLQREFHF